jgi:hypothetical protein
MMVNGDHRIGEFFCKFPSSIRSNN